MNQALTESLFAAFPRLYRGRHKSNVESSMCWGFECGDGWYQILWDLSRELSDYLTESTDIDFEVLQVKSKFGTLRFHLNYRDTVTENMIERAQKRCGVTCESSGRSN